MSAAVYGYVDSLINQHAHDLGDETAEKIALQNKAEEITITLRSGGSVWDGNTNIDDNAVLELFKEAGHFDTFAAEYETSTSDIERACISRRYIAQLDKCREELADSIAADVLEAESNSVQGF
jgi:hypothetical protein